MDQLSPIAFCTSQDLELFAVPDDVDDHEEDIGEEDGAHKAEDHHQALRIVDQTDEAGDYRSKDVEGYAYGNGALHHQLELLPILFPYGQEHPGKHGQKDHGHDDLVHVEVQAARLAHYRHLDAQVPVGSGLGDDQVGDQEQEHAYERLPVDDDEQRYASDDAEEDEHRQARGQRADEQPEAGDHGDKDGRPYVGGRACDILLVLPYLDLTRPPSRPSRTAPGCRRRLSPR
jgi:hypothetical protein